jgi:hypothetical protein
MRMCPVGCHQEQVGFLHSYLEYRFPHHPQWQPEIQMGQIRMICVAREEAGVWERMEMLALNRRVLTFGRFLVTWTSSSLITQAPEKYGKMSVPKNSYPYSEGVSTRRRCNYAEQKHEND